METNLPDPEQIRKLPPDGGPDFNRLIHSNSPYLLQHARNPVDWNEWGPEAFERARKERKPIFLSIGYSTCHWCHVMERESFENEEVAQIMNEGYICIKVDREARPDLDALYMTATQLMTGRGGWPNSLWLMADGRPWYAGTYFPPEDRGIAPGFKTVLRQLRRIWETQPEEVERQASQLAEAVRQNMQAPSSQMEGELDNTAQEAISELSRNFDAQHGGFDGAPKFPPHSALRFLSWRCRRQPLDCMDMITVTLDNMSRGGIHDHIGGGFHRYATDSEWFLPHFEKMLYDNAQLLRAYTEGFRLTGSEEYRDVALGIAEWVLRDMTDAEGGFYSALDADSEGVEGKFYLWKYDEIMQILGETDGEMFCRVYGVEPEGNFLDEVTRRPQPQNVLYLRNPREARNEPGQNLAARLPAMRRKLLARRNERVWPARDDKVLADWNGLMIGALARAGKVFSEEGLTIAAARAAEFILSKMRVNGNLQHAWRGGTASIPAFLDDYVFLAEGLLELHDATGGQKWLESAMDLVNEFDDLFADAAGGYFQSAAGDEMLIARSRYPYDQSTPSGNGTAALVLTRLGFETGRKQYFDKARAVINAFAGRVKAAAQAAMTLLLAADMLEEFRGDAGIVTAEALPLVHYVRAGESFSVRIALRLKLDYRCNTPPGVLLRNDTAQIAETQWRGQFNRLDVSLDSNSAARPGRHVLDMRLSVEPCGAERCLPRREIAVPLLLLIGH